MSAFTLRGLPLPPSANALTRNAGKRRVKTDVYEGWIEEAGWLIAAIPASERKPVAGPYALHVRAQRPNQRLDLGNIEKPISDLLVRLGLVDDDRYCERITLAWVGPGSLFSVTVIETKAHDEAMETLREIWREP